MYCESETGRERCVVHRRNFRHVKYLFVRESVTAAVKLYAAEKFWNNISPEVLFHATLYFIVLPHFFFFLQNNNQVLCRYLFSVNLFQKRFSSPRIP